MIVQELKNVSNLLLTSTKQCTLWKKMCVILFYFFSCFYGSKSLVATAAVIQKCPMLICGQQDIFNSHTILNELGPINPCHCFFVELLPWIRECRSLKIVSRIPEKSFWAHRVISPTRSFLFFPFIVNAVLPEGQEIMAIQHWFCPL